MVKKQILASLNDNLIAFSALLVCILPHCRLRDRCGNLRNNSCHVVCRLDQSASFRIFDSTFYFPYSAFRNSAFYPLPIVSYRNRTDKLRSYRAIIHI